MATGCITLVRVSLFPKLSRKDGSSLRVTVNGFNYELVPMVFLSLRREDRRSGCILLGSESISMGLFLIMHQLRK